MNFLEYYIGDDPYTSLLQIIIIILSVLILRYVYTDNKNLRKLKTDIQKLDKECPKCPDCNCEPGLTKCPDCVCPDKNTDITTSTGPNFPMSGGVTCPEVTCPEATCPSVDDIVSGLFPGRNNGITASGRYHNINANEDGTLLSAYSSYSNLRNDGEDMRLLDSSELPDDSVDRMNLGSSDTGSISGQAPLAGTTGEPIGPPPGIYSPAGPTNTPITAPTNTPPTTGATPPAIASGSLLANSTGQ